MLKITVLVVLLAVVGETFAQNYCHLCSDHTMCKYKGTGSKCAPFISSGLTKAQHQEIVDAHNKLRSKVAAGQEGAGSRGAQPPAANMRKMEWDDELAKVAQRWTDQCDYGHDACRTVERFKVGQNVYMPGISGSNGTPDWSDTVRSWYNEVKDFDRNSVALFKRSSPKGTGHYSQVVWAESYKVGCGYTKFHAGNKYHQYYVCNYGPVGNAEGGEMYKEGSPCTSCPHGAKRCKNNLCGA